jgi:hypothetical protein
MPDAGASETDAAVAAFAMRRLSASLFMENFPL